ncbi:hypothetical protein B5F09_12370 [Erysipelatoclostridium sp. An173]|uniref:DUF2812 domain-containing protein n=1 Tax=Erysipelatoclostridium sp. An173 TaxID=1965571 RepID=UPI000B389AD0|nr:DUF2812 domain-containing protein [Erysipelatoclostridium sp. An173]OUP72760.1 hypothetical protein B5F09_12370 [Erysipelatoclostridium sp. An173]
MLRIRLYLGSKSVENYINNKANKGYVLSCITKFGLFVPLRLDVYKFKKSQDKKKITYRVDSRKVNKDDMKEYKQIFLDDGWHYFTKNYANDGYSNDNIFYSYDPSKREIFSDEESKRARNRDSAAQNLWKGIFLAMAFLYLQVIFPTATSGSNDTIIGFIFHNIYIIIALSIILVSLIQYIKNR